MHPSEASCRPKNPDARARGAAPAHPRPYSSLNNRTPAAPGAAFCYQICSVFMFKKRAAQVEMAAHAMAAQKKAAEAAKLNEQLTAVIIKRGGGGGMGGG